MARVMYDYTKTILKKVSFNADLFYKEVNKALEHLLPHEVNELKIWLHEFTANKPELYASLELIKN